MNSKRYVINGKTYELPEARLEDYERLDDEFHAALLNVEYPPLPKNCLSSKYDEPMRKVVREYREKFHDLLVEVKE